MKIEIDPRSSGLGLMDHHDVGFMYITPGVVHNFPKAVGV